MAYNPYFQQNYMPQSSYQGYNAQPNNLIWVQGEAAAKSYPVAPNSSVPLWDSEANVIYIKSADMSGMPSIKILEYTVRDSAVRTAEVAPETTFATRDDVLKLEKEIDALRAKFDHAGERKKNDGK